MENSESEKEIVFNKLLNFLFLWNKFNYSPGISFLRNFIVYIPFLFFVTEVYSQEEIVTEEEIVEEIAGLGERGEFEFSAALQVEGLISTGEKLPFWMYHNRRGRISETTNFAALLQGDVNYNFLYANVKVGGGVLFQDGLYDQFAIDELYAHFTTLRFYLTAGRKHQEQLYNGLSASNRNILWSQNAPALPGLEFGTNGALFLRGQRGFGIEGSWNGYIMEEDRHVEYAKVHRVNFLLVYRTANNFQVKAGIHHFAQWGGTSKSSGPIDGGATGYLKIISGQEDFGDGNHLGSYELFLQKNFPGMYLEFFYNYLYEDNNRMAFGNFPDGRYGLYFNFTDKERVIDKVLYEFTYTRDQSSKGWDRYNQDYLNNGTYRSGWTYKERVIGSPFFTYDRERDRIGNNKFMMHHIGISGTFSEYFQSYPYRLLISGGRNDGTYRNRYFPNEDVLYFSYEMLLYQKFVNVKVQAAAEFNSLAGPLYGAGVQVSKRF